MYSIWLICSYLLEMQLDLWWTIKHKGLKGLVSFHSSQRLKLRMHWKPWMAGYSLFLLFLCICINWQWYECFYNTLLIPIAKGESFSLFFWCACVTVISIYDELFVFVISYHLREVSSLNYLCASILISRIYSTCIKLY